MRLLGTSKSTARIRDSGSTTGLRGFDQQLQDPAHRQEVGHNERGAGRSRANMHAPCIASETFEDVLIRGVIANCEYKISIRGISEQAIERLTLVSPNRFHFYNLLPPKSPQFSL